MRNIHKDYRAAFCVSGAKDDRTDAMLLEELVRRHRDKLNALEPDIELTRKRAGLVENRRSLVDDSTRLVNQWHSTLKTYFPPALDLLKNQMNTRPALTDLQNLVALLYAKDHHQRYRGGAPFRRVNGLSVVDPK